MLPGHLHIALYRPEIPQNTGTVGRLAAGSGCRLHLIPPFGFDPDDRNLKRAGLDYWPFLDMEIHQNLQDLLDLFPGKIAFIETKSAKPYTQIPTDVELLIFGQETKGLPQNLRDQYPEAFYEIPMFHGGVRSFNLANAVSIVLYHQLHRRLGEHKFKTIGSAL